VNKIIKATLREKAEEPNPSQIADLIVGRLYRSRLRSDLFFLCAKNEETSKIEMVRLQDGAAFSSYIVKDFEIVQKDKEVILSFE